MSVFGDRSHLSKEEISRQNASYWAGVDARERRDIQSRYETASAGSRSAKAYGTSDSEEFRRRKEMIEGNISGR